MRVLGADGTQSVNGVRNTGVRGTHYLQLHAASDFDILEFFRDVNGAVLDDVIVHTVKSRDLAVLNKVNFYLPRIGRPDLSTVHYSFKELYTAAFDLHDSEIVGVPIAFEKPDRS